jgi:hypothetical protein
MKNQGNPIVKFGIRIGALVVLFVFGYFAVLFITSGSLAITTGSSSASITVTSVPPLQKQTAEQGTKPAVRKTGTGTLSIRVHAGSYIVTVQNGTSQESRLVKVGWLSSTSITLKPASLTATEPVLYESVQNVAADANRMIYLNNDFNGIEYVNTQNQDVKINGNAYFTSVQWADPYYGVAQDNNGRLYVINGDTSTPLQSPIANQVSDSGASYAVAPNRTIYIAFGSRVYRGTGGGNFSQINALFDSSDSLVAANNQVMIINPNLGGSSDSGTATVVTTSDKVITKNFGYPVGGWTPWSQSGKYIEISVDSIPEIFDASLHRVGNIPSLPAISIGTWSGDNTLYYVAGGQLWSYDLPQNDTKLIAEAPDDKAIQGLTVSSDGSYVYASASNNNDTYPRIVFRVGLKGQGVSSDLNDLQSVLPVNTSTFTIGLRNFSSASQPVIAVTAYPGTDTGDAMSQSQDVIGGMINVNDVTFDVESGD